MEKVQHMTRSAIRRASTMEVPPQAKQNLQDLFVNFCLILICLLLIYVILLLIRLKPPSDSWALACRIPDSPTKLPVQVCYTLLSRPTSMDLVNNRGLNLILNFLLIVVVLILMLILVKLM